jgi:hypothetical protein
MDDLGYLSDPGNRLGMLDAQAFRASRVIVDIGMHLELEIPKDNPFGFHPGERWTPELGWEFMRAHCRVEDEQLKFELNRYLGWPGQAPSYKVGERIWLQARDDARARKGADFDLKAFHRAALDLGSLGLDPLRAALSRICECRNSERTHVGAATTACRGGRLLAGARGTVGHHDARRPRRRRDQSGASGHGRRHPDLGPAARRRR